MKVIGTAGHIDHGKSTLVHALTGIDPDRLMEEKQRGMTIDLGFAWLSLPVSGDVSIVDVPGHERFVKNMLAGAGGIDVGLLVIAADEAVMPQTREHVAILDLLGIPVGVVALTKADLVDEELLMVSESEVAELLLGTTLEGSPIATVSARTRQGIPHLISLLDRQVSRSPEPEASAVPYLPIDRVFHVAGFGTVVTGTVHGGNFSVGDELQVIPGYRKVRVRGVQTHRRAVTQAGPGSRAAVNVVGAAREDLNRGDVLAFPGSIDGIRRFDARLKVLADAPFALVDGLEVSLHIGAAERTARLFLHESEQLQPGSHGWVQVRTTEDVAVVRGQRFILRLPAPGRTVAGGQVVETRPTRKRADVATLARFEQLNSLNLRDIVAAALAQDRVHYAQRLATRLGLHESMVADELRALAADGKILSFNNAYIDRDRFNRIAHQSRIIAEQYHAKHPLREGTPSEEMRRKLRWDASEWSGLVRLLNEHGILESRGSTIAIPGHIGGSGAQAELANQVVQFLRQFAYNPPALSDITEHTGAPEDLLRALVSEERIVRLADGVFVEKSIFNRMVEEVCDLIRQDGQVTVATVRDAFGTSRKSVLALLEYLDSQQITRRIGDSRIMGPKGNRCA